MGSPPRAVLDLGVVDAVVLDTDGVITDTARTHAAAWKRAFDELLRERGRRTGVVLPPFDAVGDYLRYVDGRARADGARAFLDSRGITLDAGGAGDEQRDARWRPCSTGRRGTSWTRCARTGSGCSPPP
ncbi:hypothetical protein ACFWEJ_13250 [Promicromonospora sp. NPDC060204]|uniref:hypothetical protein n=1 Tax=Promicromonospora sp. NPDC060204 TaxID=3347071 RepID=UPI00364697ED